MARIFGPAATPLEVTSPLGHNVVLATPMVIPQATRHKRSLAVFEPNDTP